MMTPTGRRRKRVAAVTILALVVTSIAAFAPSPAVASYFEEGVSFSSVIVRDSVPFDLSVKAVRAMGSVYRLDVSISKVEDPAGPTELRQRHTWTFELEAHEFYEEDDVYYIDAGGDQEPFHVQLVVERRADAACSEEQPLFVSEREGGAFRMETGNDVFGTITELSDCGSRYWFAHGPQPPPPPCPAEGIRLYSGSLEATRSFQGDVARLDLYDADERDAAGHPVSWFVRVRGALPAKRFRLNRDFEGSLSAGGAPWLEGMAWFEPRGRVRRNDWYNCGKAREARSFVRNGAITGDLTLDVIGYESHRFSEPDALAIRSWVRPRR